VGRWGGELISGLWVDRKFNFDHLTEADFPSLVDCLRATPARVETAVRGLSRERLKWREGDSWSVQEQIGHLLEVDALHDGRLEDYRAGASVLRAADMENKRTHAGGYNDRTIEEVLAAFRGVRGRFVERLDAWEPERRLAVALHPRLQQPMRVVDMLFFAAEHDEHHLVRVSELAQRERGAGSLAGPRAP
jgi:uncharacterized damage-inducible protein DinB